MEKIIIANHKMNMDKNQIIDYIKKISNHKQKFIICPTSIYIPYFIQNNFITGTQNIHYENTGPYTGEISPKQAKSLGVEYVIIGHSERRKQFNETNNQINKKIKAAIENNLKVILCIGEEEFEDYKEVLKKQITEGLKDIDKEIIIAYEPVWAIGSGKTPTNETIIEVIKYIKSLLNYDVKVLYGGSVNKDDIHILNQIKEVSGYLIGKPSIDAEELIKIGEVVS